MHWIYLTLFVVVLLVPQFVVDQNIESLLLFAIGMIGFGLFQVLEQDFKKHIADKKKYQREASDVSKDLVHSYSYIGEINRQLEILKNIALGLPESGAFTEERRRETFDAIIEAIMVFARSEQFCLRFVNTRSKQVEENLGMGDKKFLVSVPRLIQQKKEVAELNSYSIVRAPRALRGYAAFIIIDRKNISPEDVEFLRAIASQALFLFAWGRSMTEEEKKDKPPAEE